MPGSDENQTERMEARVIPGARAAIESAAELRGRCAVDVIVAATPEAACRAMASILRLSAEDRRAISDGVLDPPSPNDALRRAAVAHRRLPG